ncbi:hypothetical protein EV401DRAFT_1976528 [Pisolithus croceorrhizus]|nr:hypothetical protein EV401DRAFT_1976528 [Pisolithus croceorrhizus]
MVFFRAVLVGLYMSKEPNLDSGVWIDTHSLMKRRSTLAQHEAAVVSRRLVDPLVDAILLLRWGYGCSLTNSDIKAPQSRTTKFKGDDCEGHSIPGGDLSWHFSSSCFDDFIGGFSVPKNLVHMNLHSTRNHMKHCRAMHIIVGLNTISRHMNPVWTGDWRYIVPPHLTAWQHDGLEANNPPAIHTGSSPPDLPAGQLMVYSNNKAPSWLATLLYLQVAHDNKAYSFCCLRRNHCNVLLHRYPAAAGRSQFPVTVTGPRGNRQLSTFITIIGRSCLILPKLPPDSEASESSGKHCSPPSGRYAAAVGDIPNTAAE